MKNRRQWGALLCLCVLLAAFSACRTAPAPSQTDVSSTAAPSASEQPSASSTEEATVASESEVSQTEVAPAPSRLTGEGLVVADTGQTPEEAVKAFIEALNASAKEQQPDLYFQAEPYGEVTDMPKALEWHPEYGADAAFDFLYTVVWVPAPEEDVAAGSPKPYEGDDPAVPEGAMETMINARLYHTPEGWVCLP